MGSLVLTMAVGCVYAGNSYYPPEHLDCKRTATSDLKCESFNRAYLIENTTTADFDKDKPQAFLFYSGAAYYANQQHDEVTVIYTYHNAAGKNVTLKTVDTSITPDLKNGAWVTKGDISTCDAGYRSCPITNLPMRK